VFCTATRVEARRVLLPETPAHRHSNEATSFAFSSSSQEETPTVPWRMLQVPTLSGGLQNSPLTSKQHLQPRPLIHAASFGGLNYRKGRSYGNAKALK
jgi:hypothetical protein